MAESVDHVVSREDVVVDDILAILRKRSGADLRAYPQTRSAILIALAGYASHPDKRAAQSAGFDAHVAKPLSLSGLPKIIARVERAGARGN